MVSAEILQKITERLLQEFHPDRIILFGSQARGDANEGSDYDVFVLVDKRTSEIREAAIDAGVEMMNRYDKLFASIIYGEEEWQKAQGSPFLWNIQQEGIDL